jgi:uncharacterized membrane protein YdbT with pleckstrin-like domain
MSPDEQVVDEQIIFHGHPSWRSMFAFHMKGIALAVLAGIVAGVASSIADGSVQVPWVIAAVLLIFVMVVLLGWFRRLTTTYTVSDRRLTIERGLLSRDVHETRLERVQNVNSSQSLLQRMLRVGTVDFDTAGSAQFNFAFRGVDHPHRIVRAVDEALHQLQRSDAVNP